MSITEALERWSAMSFFTEMNNQNNPSEINRRNFIGSFSSLMTLMGGVAIARAQEKKEGEKERYSGPPLGCAVIGCGQWGREILSNLSRLPKANVVGICDTYGPYMNRGQNVAPKAKKYSNYTELLADKAVQAVIIATPTHLHKQIVLDAIQAGKHIYCEAPLAHTLEDARVIAKAAKGAGKVYFQAGLQQRSDPELIHILEFVRAGAAGSPLLTRAQSHKKNSWRRSSPNPEFENALNWRLRKETSIGLVGELGIHNIDAAGWFMNRRAVSVTGFGSTILWNDGRDLPDTVQAVVEYTQGARLLYDATLANSFDSEYDTYYGTDATVMVRDRRGWMFKEVDSPLLGWEVYARKETFFKEVGIVLAANATKLAAQGDNPVIDTQVATQGSLYYALDAFITNADLTRTGIEDFTATYGTDDPTELGKYLADVMKNKLPAADWKLGFEATVTAIKAHEAVMKHGRVELKDELFNIG
ncbi:MAG TPA: Gfo/Idh/MocA family oxidoreductase [Verrucomicrobiae bacterium]|nr:Gfo/Idh/MocA family oxidoreductase [Verrucomicrobiae bacterium]